METDLQFDLEFEKEILAQALKDKKYLKEASRVLNAHHFGTEEHSWCWKVIFDTWNKYKEIPIKKLFSVRAKSDFDDVDERLKNYRTAKALLKLKPKSPRANLEQLIEFVKFVNAQKGMENALDKLNKNDIDGAYKEFGKLSRKTYEAEDYTRIQWIECFEERQKERKYLKENPELIVRVPTGFKKVDKIMGGLEAGELGLIMATTSQGKSAMLTNLAYIALSNPIRKFKVAYFSFEMSARQIATRQDARWLRMDYNKFKYYNFSKKEKKEIKRKLKIAKKKMAGMFEIISLPLGTPTLDRVDGILEDIKNENGFEPNLLIFDSPDHMKPNQKQDNIRLSHKAVYTEVKGYAEEKGYAIWASTHAGREWFSKIATAEASGESYDKSRIADAIITLNTPDRKTRSTKVILEEDDEDDNTTIAKYRYLEMYLAKYRGGEARVSIPIDANFSKMFFKEIEV